MLRARYRRILFFFAQVIASLALWELILPRIGFRKTVQRTRSERLRQIAARGRTLAVQMGGVLIKVGQFLSSRVDVLPEEITAELAGLQDEVPPEDFADIRRVAEADLGAPLADKFAAFDETPLAAASLGQVHRAQLPPQPAPPGGGPAVPTDVVVKVQRPHIDAIIDTDMAALHTVGRWLHRYGPIRRRADVPALLGEFERVIHEEIDYLAEGRNAETIAANFKDRPGLRVPRVVWTHTTRCVLTLEDVFAIKITDYAAIKAAGVDRTEVARRLFDIYLRQIFEDGFFHADPHPGNLFVQPQPDGQWQLTFVDFGMVGRVTPRLRAGLRELTIAVGTADSGRMVHAYQLLGVLLPHADVALLERAGAKAFERFWGKSTDELRRLDRHEMGALALEFRELLYSLPFQIPHDLLLLGRTMGILTGMCSGLDPAFNVWASVAPYAQKLIAEEDGSRLSLVIDQLADAARALLALPARVDSILRKIEAGEMSVQTPQIERQMCRLETMMRRMIGVIIFLALLVGGVQLDLANHMWPAAALLAAAGVTLVWVLTTRCPED